MCELTSSLSLTLLLHDVCSYMPQKFKILFAPMTFCHIYIIWCSYITISHEKECCFPQLYAWLQMRYLFYTKVKWTITLDTLLSILFVFPFIPHFERISLINYWMTLSWISGLNTSVEWMTHSFRQRLAATYWRF